jgi:hypothetical protein
MTWRRYPGRLAHLEGDPMPLMENGARAGTLWRARCGRELRLWWNERPWQSDYVDVDELREENPRGWCLRCAYWAARDALCIVGWDFDLFVREVYAGRWPLTLGGRS